MSNFIEKLQLANHLFPTEIIEEILLKLPVKSLLRFKSVSKQWQSLIADHRFIQLVLNQNRHKILLQAENSLSFRSVDLEPLLSKPENSYHTATLVMTEEELKLRNFKASVEGSCDGLVLLHLSSDLSDQMILWNPSTRETRVIPNPPVHSGLSKLWAKWRHGIGYDSSADDYKLLRICFLPREITSKEEDITLRIFSLRTNSWKTIDPRKGYNGLSYVSILFLNGAIHLVVNNRKSSSGEIISYDLSENKFSETLLPNQMRIKSLELLEINGSLCFIETTRSERTIIWEIKDKECRARAEFMFPIYWSKFRLFFEGKLVWLKHTQKQLCICDLEEQNSCKELFLTHGSLIYFGRTNYVESLVSPNWYLYTN